MGEGRLSWNDAKVIASHYFQFWEDGEDYLWAKYCWSSLEKSGMTIFYSDKEKMIVRSYAALLALFYQEALCRLGIDNFDRLDDSKINEIFESSYNEIEEHLIAIRSALAKDNDMLFFRIFLMSVYSGEREMVSLHHLFEEVETQLKGSDMSVLPLERASDFFTGSNLHVDYFESLGYLPKDKGNKSFS